MRLRLPRGEAAFQIALTLACFTALWVSLYPTVYTFDSAEFALGAATLGIVHAPGYALYLLCAHIFTLLPVGDIGFRVNLFSAVCLALTAPILWTVCLRLVRGRVPALVGTFSFLWLLTTWHTGTVAEIYAPQTLTLAMCMESLFRLWRTPSRRWALITGGAVGVAVAMHPVSVLLIGGVVIAFLVLRLKWTWRVGGGLLAIGVFLATLIYFPLRQATNPVIMYAGEFGIDGVYHAFDLATPSGLLWLLSGQQFGSLFFVDGILPSGSQLVEWGGLLWSSYTGYGVIIGSIGLIAFARAQRKVFLCWLVSFLPYTYFYITYGAVDKNMMFGPMYLLLSIPIAFGIKALAQPLPEKIRPFLIVLAFVPLLLNASRIFQRNQVEIRARSLVILNALPENALVFGLWGDVVPLEYLHLLEGVRSDLTIRNLFFFPTPQSVLAYIAREEADNRSTFMFMSERAPLGLDTSDYMITPLRVMMPNANNPTRIGFVFNKVDK